MCMWQREVEAYRRTWKDGAAGIDGVTAADYEKVLETNLEDLLNRIRSGGYFCATGAAARNPESGRHGAPPGHSEI